MEYVQNGITKNRWNYALIQRIRWFDHTYRLPVEKVTRTVIEGATYTKQKSGRPRRWFTTIEYLAIHQKWRPEEIEEKIKH